MADKIYVKGIVLKEKDTSFGSVLKVSLKLDDFGAFVKANKKPTGWINFDILPRKEASDKGETHYAVLDTWEPTNGGGNGGDKPAAKKTQQQKPAAKKTESDEFPPDDDIPF